MSLVLELGRILFGIPEQQDHDLLFSWLIMIDYLRVLIDYADPDVLFLRRWPAHFGITL